MLTIIFKNVGHGDTIIVEWQNEKGDNEIGIIDCHRQKGKPHHVIDHIKRNGYKRIYFMILSHPHTDHFSGFPSLLEFCKEKSIRIERFWHTAAYDTAFIGEAINRITPDEFSDSFVNREKDRIKLRGLFREIDNLRGGPILKEAGIANNTSGLDLNKKLRLEFVSPSGYDELMKYCTGAFQPGTGKNLTLTRRDNNPEANLFSTVIRIKTENWHVLLTSDALNFTFKRIGNSNLDWLDNKLVAVQIPHHGSRDSHFADLWHRIPGKEKVPVFVSSDGKYKLPAKEIIEFFDKNYKEIHATNFAGGYREYFAHQHSPTGEIEIQHLNSPFYIYDQHFLNSLNRRESENDAIACGEKRVKILEDGFITIATISNQIPG